MTSARIMQWGLIIISLFVAVEASAQVRPTNRERLYPALLDKESGITDAQVQKVRTLFQTVESGILEGDIGAFSGHFDKQLFVNISREKAVIFRPTRQHQSCNITWLRERWCRSDFRD